VKSEERVRRRKEEFHAIECCQCHVSVKPTPCRHRRTYPDIESLAGAEPQSLLVVNLQRKTAGARHHNPIDHVVRINSSCALPYLR
jgi:hypothetical protein